MMISNLITKMISPAILFLPSLEAYFPHKELDAIHKGGEHFGFAGSIPLEKAMSAEVLLAYEMNGEPLPLCHGFPLRVLVPGYIGARSVKWLASIVLQEEPSTNYYQVRAYKLFPPHMQAESADWTQGQMLGALPLNSVIFRPCEGELLKAGPICIQGYALAREGHSIDRVELSSDGGATWADATLLEQPQPWTWCFWEITLPLDSGTRQLIVRAWDSAGGTQPAEVRQVWNWKGYVNNAWHRVNVVVQQASAPRPNQTHQSLRLDTRDEVPLQKILRREEIPLVRKHLPKGYGKRETALV